MTLRNTDTSYGPIAKWLHWLVVVLIPVMFVLEHYMRALEPSATKWLLYDLHKSFGVTLLALVLLRIGWRSLNPAPRPPAGLLAWQQSAARINHALLYIALLVMPLTGYLGSIAGGFEVTFFRLVNLPHLVHESESLNLAAEAVHAVTANVLLALVTLHVAAALWHHLWRQDEVLARMLPGGTLRKARAEASSAMGAHG